MTDIRDDVVIAAPIDSVWRAIRDPVSHSAWHPFLKHIAGEHTLGAVRKCDVLVGGKPGTTEERCSAYEEGRRIIWDIQQDSSGFSRMVADWSAGFKLTPLGTDSTRVTALSIFRPRKLVARLMFPVIKSKFHKAQKAILAGLKQYAES